VERQDQSDTGRSNVLLTASPMSVDAALEPIRRENRVPPIQWPLPRRHGKKTWKLEGRPDCLFLAYSVEKVGFIFRRMRFNILELKFWPS
jgi:hypothetical protein